MRLPDDIIIPRKKLTDYLLVYQLKNDKSKFLAQAGFTLENPDDLEQAIRNLIAENDAIVDREDEYGIVYRVSGILRGSLDDLNVITVWVYAAKHEHYRFITLKPDKE